MSKKIGLTRRQALAGLGTIGIASAGAGLGTSALFSDTESFDGNTITAGTLDLKVDYASYWDQGSAGTGQVTGTADGSAVTAELSDVKPGDSGLIALCPRIETNPAYLWLCGELTSSQENGYTEPEPEDDNGEGELEEAVDVDVNYCTVDDDVSDDGGFNRDDVTTEATAWSGTLAELLAMIQTGVALDGDGEGPNSDPVGFPEPGEQAEFSGSASGEPSDNYCICLDWSVDFEDVGNEIQGDSLMFDLALNAQQSRNNDGATNPCADETFTAPYINDSGSATQIQGTLRMDVNYGENAVAYRVQMDDDDSGAKMSDPLNSSTNVWIPFDTNDDGTMDFQIQWYPGAGLPDDPFGSKTHNGSWGSQNGLPAGVTAAETDEGFVVVVPKSELGGSGAYRVGAHMSAGGEAPYAAISTESATGEIVPSGNFSSADYLIQTNVP
jgi:predicted ribosomally synthesized peptide with SipW-like signal peptide